VAADSPAWRRAFDSVERRVSRPLGSTTSSTNFQVAARRFHSAARAVTRPIEGVTTWALHLAGLPTQAEIRDLKRQLGQVQREMIAFRRDLPETRPQPRHEPP
jgi:hypothetical protein